MDAIAKVGERGDHVRRALTQIRAPQVDRFVPWKEMSVVAQQHEVVGLDVGVGRVGVRHLNRASRDGAIGELVRHAPNVVLRQVVGAAQTLPAVAAVQKLVGEAEDEPGVGAQVRDGLDVELLRERLTHGERVVVAEPEVGSHGDAFCSEGGGESAPVVGELATGEDLAGDGARVLGVDVNIAVTERVPQYAGAAELAPLRDAGAGLAGDVGRDVAENHRFGERLRSHDDERPSRLLRRGGQSHQNRGGCYKRSAGHDGVSGRASRCGRCARTNRRTRSLAGCSTRSSRVPLCATAPSCTSTRRSAK